MKNVVLVASAVVLVSSATGQAALIDVGSHNLLPNTPNQSVLIYATASPNELASGFQLFARIGDGHPDIHDGASDTPEPVIQSVDFGDMWDDYEYTELGGPLPVYGMYADAGTAFNVAGNAVSPNGLVVTLMIDTTGFFGGSYPLWISGIPELGDSTFIGVPLEVVNGQLNIVPEPSALTILILCGTVMACGTSWARRRMKASRASHS